MLKMFFISYINLNIHIKKRLLYEERKEDLRKEYQKQIQEITQEVNKKGNKDIIYLDESGFDIRMKKEYGWSIPNYKSIDIFLTLSQ